MAQAERSFITRRHLVAGAATVIPALGGLLPVHAAASDPIFAAIDAHRRAYADVLALLDAQAAAAQALQAADAAAYSALAARLDALCVAEGPLGLVEMKASARLAATVPASLDGAVAVLRYARALFERDDYPLCEDHGYRTLLFSIERAIVASRLS